jgi:hypothetical protein
MAQPALISGVTELANTQLPRANVGGLRMAFPASHAVFNIAHFEKLIPRGERIEQAAAILQFIKRITLELNST